MKRLLLASIALTTVAACFDFDGAYNQYCLRNNCGSTGDGGTGGGASGGGSTAGGTAGASTAGGSTAGGAAGGTSTAGGAAAGGSAAGGSTAGGSGGGAAGGSGGGDAGGSAAGGSAIDAGTDAGVDAGVECIGQPFCVFRQTQRLNMTGSVYFADALVGTTLTQAQAIFSKFNNPVGALWVSHGNDPTPSPGTARAFAAGTPPYKINGGSTFDFVLISESSMTNARVQRIIDGGIPQVRYSGTCQGASFFANLAVRDGNRVLIGGYNEGLCELNLTTGQTTILQTPNVVSPNEYVSAIYAAPTGEVFWGTTDGYIGQLGVGRVTTQLDVDGIIGLDGTDLDNLYAVTEKGVVAKREQDAGFSTVADIQALASVSYSLRVTSDGVFVGAYGGIVHKDRFTDGGFEFFGLPVDPNNRPFFISGGPGAIHVAGDEGNFSNPSGAYFISLIPRTQ